MKLFHDADWNKPDLHEQETLRKEYDAVTDKYYALKEDEKLVHYQNTYELDENGKAFQPMHTKIVKKDNAHEEVWRSDYEQEVNELEWQGQKVKVASWVKPVEKRVFNSGLIDELQRETDMWLENVVMG